MENTYAITDIAGQFDRLCPGQVDDSSGHSGHDHGDDNPTIGWFCDGGNVGNHVCSIPADCIDPLQEYLIALPDGSLDDGGLEEIVINFGGKWEP